MKVKGLLWDHGHVYSHYIALSHSLGFEYVRYPTYFLENLCVCEEPVLARLVPFPDNSVLICSCKKYK